MAGSKVFPFKTSNAEESPSEETIDRARDAKRRLTGEMREIELKSKMHAHTIDDDVAIRIGSKEKRWSSELMHLDSMDEDFQEKPERSSASVFDLLGVDKSRSRSPWRNKLQSVLDGTAMTTFMTLLTIVVLFLDDIRVAVMPPEADRPIVIITYVAFVCFAVELILNSLSKPKFFLGFYFWLDLVSTLSLMGDIPEFMQLIMGESENGNGGVNESTTLARAGRTSRAGTRAGRIARVMRLVRLIRLVKLYRQYESNKDKQSDLRESPEDIDVDVAESRVGQRLSDLTTRRVIIGVLGMLFILPLFEIEGGYYGQLSTFDTEGLEMIHEVALGTDANSTAVEHSINVFSENVHYSLGNEYTSHILELVVLNVTKIEREAIHDHRTQEVSSSRYETDACRVGDWDHCYTTTALFDTKWAFQLNAILNIVKTIFIILVLGLGALFFSRDANELVLRPLERMIRTVKEISENPLARQAISEELEEKKEDVDMETRILEASLKKVCSLLAVGFGDAGAQIIAENIKNGGALNPMVPGRKMIAIFGFCDIRQFTDTTEVLQEEIMEFVNAIAQIVHSEVAYHGGAANKNIGDAFLLVWKLPNSTRTRDVRAIASEGEKPSDFKIQSMMRRQVSEVSALRCDTLPTSRSLSLYPHATLSNLRESREDRRIAIQNVADKALAAFIVIHAAIKRSAHIKTYTERGDLNQRMPGFQVRMGFGLHVGWAIEGAIGSDYKIDASYLSPNVNMASRLEAATKQFRTSVLLSSDFVGCLSPKVQSRVRQIDQVTVKGSKKPMGLFTYDIDLDAIAEPQISDTSSDLAYISYSKQEYNNEWMEHPDLSKTWAVDETFLSTFATGFEHYRGGDWTQARSVLEECRWARRDSKNEKVEDGPSVTLLEYMAQFDYQAPDDWPGFRELIEK